MKFYKTQLEEGTIQKAYQSLMNFILYLRNDMAKKYENDYIIGNISKGQMDYTYFPIIPKKIKFLQLKFVLYFIHREMRFDISLSGQNSQIRERYRKILSGSQLHKYQITPASEDEYSVVHGILVEKPDFNDSFQLNLQIEHKAIEFIEYITELLDRNKPASENQVIL